MRKSSVFLSGGGEMGALMRAHDWSATALGSADRWPQSLRVAVRILLNTGHPMYIFWGSKGACLYNDAYRKSIGPERHPGSLGRPAREVWGEIWNVIGPQIEHVMDGRGATWHRNQLVPITRNGTREDVYWTYSYGPIDDDASANGIGGVLVVCNETTAEAVSAKRLAESEARFRGAVDAVQGILWTNSADGRMLGSQPGWSALTGQSAAEYEGYGWAAAVHPDDAQPTIEAWKAAVADRRTFLFEHRVRRRDGSWGTFSIRAIPILDAEREVREWVGVHTDVTAERAAEASLKEINATLEQRVQERTVERDRAWKNSRDLQAVSNRDGVFCEANAAWSTILGWRTEEVVGRNYLDLIHPEDHAASERAFAVASAGDLPIFENRYLHKDGGYRWISWLAAPEGRLIYASGRNVTSEKEREENLAKVEEALRQSQKMEAVGQLTGGLAHDFNNLLTVIHGSLEMLEQRLVQGRVSDLGRFVAAAQSASKRAASLTHRLLAFSRRQTLDPKPTEVNQLIAGMDDLLRRTVGPEIGVEVIAAAGLWTTLVDPHQLENALLNLSINARDAMPDGGRLTIETSNRWLDEGAARERDVPPGQYILLCVRDTGGGMPPDVIARAFEPFFTTKPIGQGTGLGLSMVYGFARQSGGQVRIASEAGDGATVCIYLPRHDGSGIEDGEIAVVAPSRAEQGQTVLVVDDEPNIRMLIVGVLEELGYGAIEASDGPAGLKVLRSDIRVDLLVTDVGLPGGMNGRQVADAGRSLRPDLKILFITGYAENAAIGNGQLDPGMAIVTKPFSVDALANRIKELISAR